MWRKKIFVPNKKKTYYAATRKLTQMCGISQVSASIAREIHAKKKMRTKKVIAVNLGKKMKGFSTS